MSNSRTKNSLLTMSSSVIQQVVSMLIGFVSRYIFIKILGAEYLGLNGVFLNILSFLSLAELGITSAIGARLYKPLATNDKEELKSYVDFFRKAYFVIGTIIFVVGLCLIPFLPYLVNLSDDIDVNYTLVYVMFLFNTASSYFLFSYKQTVLSADQKGYYINGYNTVFSTIASFSKCVILLVTHSYILSLGTEILLNLTKSVAIGFKADKLHPELKEKNIKPLQKKQIRELFLDVKGLVINSVGDTLFNSTDTIIISVILGTIFVGLYDTYYQFEVYIVVLMGMVISSAQGAVGNMNVLDSQEKTIKTFREINYLNFLASSFCSVCLCKLLTPFIFLIFGKELIISQVAVIFMVINFYIATIRNTSGIFKFGKGLLKEGQYANFICGIINVILSIWWAKPFGLAGIFAGTIVTRSVSIFISFTYYLFKKGFNLPVMPELWRIIKEFGITAIIYILVELSCIWIKEITVATFVFEMVMCVVISGVMLLLYSYKKQEFKDALARGKYLLNKATEKFSKKQKG